MGGWLPGVDAWRLRWSKIAYVVVAGDFLSWVSGSDGLFVRASRPGIIIIIIIIMNVLRLWW
jgi:hypothetical protein